MSMNRWTGRFVALAVVGVAAWTATTGKTVAAADLADLATQPLGDGEAFSPVSAARLETAAGRLRAALGPLDALLARSTSGTDWRRYLDWSALKSQAAAGSKADAGELRRLFQLLDAGENGLEMPQFAAVRRAVAGYAEAVEASRNPDAGTVYSQRLEKLAAAVAAGAAAGTMEPLDSVGPLLARLEESGQGKATVARIRSAVNRPNLFLDVDESLLGAAVNRAVDEVAPVNETLLGTRVRGSGHTTGIVFLDFVPSADRAVIDLKLDATNRSRTRGSQGPVTVHTLGTTKVDARKRITIDGDGVSAQPADVHASTDTQTAGIGVNARFGKRLIRKIASRKIAEMRPRAEAISAAKARQRVRGQFEEQTGTAIGQAARDYQTRFRRPLAERGWFPELLAMNTSESRLSVVARKSLTDQIAAFSAPPAVDADAVLAARVHETAVNNVAEITLGGRTITQEFVEEQLRKNNGTLPEALGNDPDQKPWSITFAKRKPVQLDADDNRVKVTVRGSRFTSGDREFPAMDIWAAYRIEPGPNGIRLVRDGDVQIYPPGFVPGGAEKLTMAETSLRRILQKRFNKVFEEVSDVKPLRLPAQLAHAGPLPMEQFVARKDGWVAVGWRKRGPETPVAAAAPAEGVVALAFNALIGMVAQVEP
jgi:hypothetical protein